MDSAVIIVDALAGVQAQTRTVWKQVQNQNLACVAFVNKMDRDGSNFSFAISTLRDKLGVNAVPIQVPVSRQDNFCGVIDLVCMRGLYWDDPPSSSSRLEANGVWTEIITPAHEQFQEAVDARAELAEKIADVDEDFLNIFLTTELDLIKEDSILDALRRGCVAGLLVPAVCGASLKNRGVEPLLNAISYLLPSPLERHACTANNILNGKEIDISTADDDLVAFAFKVIVDPNRGALVFVRNFSGEISSKSGVLWNVTKQKKERPHQLLKVSADDLIQTDCIGHGDIGCIVGLKHTVTGDTLVLHKGKMKDIELEGIKVPDTAFSLAIEPQKSSQYDSLIKALSVLVLEDPSLKFEVNEESGQLLIHGIGELHLEIICDKLDRQFNVPVEIGDMFVAYRESIGIDERIDEKTHIFDKVMGGKRFFAEISGSVWRDSANTVPTAIIDDNIRKTLRNDEYFALTDGLQKSFLMGPAGYPLVGISVQITALSFDPATSLGSIRAGISSFVDSALRSVDNTILEPYMSLQVDLPTTYVGDVLSDLTVARRAIIQDVGNSSGEFSTIRGQVPLSTMLGYASTVRSLSQGQGNFSMEYTGHQPIVGG
mmetsp:Transcript_13820/g.22877  ORF Transcript_13820/g.22877 Transcript_13820/m.22877 type:complete len:601 (+) Transcript_13820:545-2347(+)